MSARLLPLLFLALPAGAADVYIGITGTGDGQPPLLAAPAFGPLSTKPEDAELAGRMHAVFEEDLLFSRWFRLASDGPGADAPPAVAMNAWAGKGAVGLALGRVSAAGGKAFLEARLFDLAGKSSIFEKRYETPAENWRALPHTFADEVVLKLTGRRGIAKTKLAFVGDATGSKEVYVMDYDGEGRWQVTKDKGLCLLPRWSPDGRRLAYATWRHGNPDIYAIDLVERKPRPLVTSQGLNLPGGFSPDGRRLLYTASRQRSPNLFLKDLETGEVRQVSFHTSVDSSAAFAPDGREAAFVSDRTGNPQIHVLELETGRTRKLTDLNWSDSPAWQPTGEWIAFSGRPGLKDRMDVYLVDPTGTRLKQLTRSAGSNENPTWSPDGRFLAFTSTRDGRRRLWVMDADGSAPQPVGDFPGDAFTPSWGP